MALSARSAKAFALHVVLAAGLAGAALAAPSPAGTPIELPTLTRIASRLSGLQAHTRVTVVMRNAAGMRSEAQRLLDRDYPADQQAYDETVYLALGLLQIMGNVWVPSVATLVPYALLIGILLWRPQGLAGTRLQ